MRAPVSLVSLGLAVVLGCAAGPPPTPPGTSAVYGEVRLVPRAGVKPSGGGGSYGDRRLRDVELVDYSTPGFAIVYADAAEAPGGEALVTIRSSRLGVALEPEHLAVGSGGSIVVENSSDATHVVSHPDAGVLVELPPGERVELDPAHVGEQRLYLLDVPSESITVFAAPGPFTVVGASGGYELAGLEAGRGTLHAWHPRFPSAAHALDLAPDRQVRFDFELGVGASRGIQDVD